MSKARVSLLAVLVTALIGPAAANAKDPVLFVHGFKGSGSNWDTYKSRMLSGGYTSAQLVSKTYNSDVSNATTAQAISSDVNALLAATGATKVDIITHSMGGLSSRYYLKNLGGQPKVDEWVSLAGPNHGSHDAEVWYCFSVACDEMTPGSSFLTALNSGDETPGTPRYGTWWSPCDDRIDPISSTALSGATNTQAPCIGHRDFLSNTTVYNQVMAFIAQ